MSVQRRGKGWVVRWRDGRRHFARTFLKARDADALDIDVKRRKQLGTLATGIMQSKITLAEFVREDWWPRYVVVNLKPTTQERYLEIWGTHLLPRLGDFELRAITPTLLEDVLAEMASQRIGIATRRKAAMVLQGILRRAVVRGFIPNNPVLAIAKPRQPAPLRREPLPPSMVEAIRNRLRLRDATLVSVLAYAGLRPGEATSARWADLSGTTLYVHASKTETARSIRILDPLRQDLAEWRIRCGSPLPTALIFPMRGGKTWTKTDWANWRRRVYQPAARAAGLTGDLTPYRLRGSFDSLLLWEGRSLPYVSEQGGHGIATLARHYAGVLQELEHAPRVAAAEAIRAARAAMSSAQDVRKTEGRS